MEDIFKLGEYSLCCFFAFVGYLFLLKPILVLLWMVYNCLLMQVSSVTDHVGAQDSGQKTADFDDDDGGGLVG